MSISANGGGQEGGRVTFGCRLAAPHAAGSVLAVALQSWPLALVAYLLLR